VSIRACPQGRLRTLLGNSAVHDRRALTLIYDNDQGYRLTKLVANQKQCGPDSVSLKSFGMERLAERSAKQISRGERASANEKVPSQTAARDFQKLPEIDSGGECDHWA
jgi:hypothetical protein